MCIRDRFDGAASLDAARRVRFPLFGRMVKRRVDVEVRESADRKGAHDADYERLGGLQVADRGGIDDADGDDRGENGPENLVCVVVVGFGHYRVTQLLRVPARTGKRSVRKNLTILHE